MSCLAMDPGPAEVTSVRNTASWPSVSESAFYVDWQVVLEQLESYHCTAGTLEKILKPDACTVHSKGAWSLSPDWMPKFLQSSWRFLYNQDKERLSVPVCRSLRWLDIGMWSLSCLSLGVGLSSVPVGNLSSRAGLLWQLPIVHCPSLPDFPSHYIFLPGHFAGSLLCKQSIAHVLYTPLVLIMSSLKVFFI